MRAYNRSNPMRMGRLRVLLGTLAVGAVLGFLVLSAFAHAARAG